MRLVRVGPVCGTSLKMTPGPCPSLQNPAFVSPGMHLHFCGGNIWAQMFGSDLPEIVFSSQNSFFHIEAEFEYTYISVWALSTPTYPYSEILRCAPSQRVVRAEERRYKQFCTGLHVKDAMSLGKRHRYHCKPILRLTSCS